MKKLTLVLSALALLAATVPAQATNITFTGGTVYLSGGGTGTTNNVSLWTDVVDYYVEGDFKFDFIGDFGTVGDYYSIGAGGFVGNDVVHAHWSGVSFMVISRTDGLAFDLNYLDITSNTTIGGGQATGTEVSSVTTNSGHSMVLPSSDWGFATDYYGQVGDGVARLWLDSNFDGVTSVTFTSTNAYCFGMDNFYIDEEAPSVPDAGSSLLLLGIGIAGLRAWRKRLG